MTIQESIGPADAPTRYHVSAGEIERMLVDAAQPGRPLLAYVHVPFCNTKCTFCHWMSAVPVKQMIAGSELHASYVGQLCAQIAHYGAILRESDYRPVLVYWGGGTPTKLAADDMRRVGEALRRTLPLQGVAEYTIESSPDTLDRDKLLAFREIGGTRLSIGVQSFDDDELRQTARAHSADDAAGAVSIARETGVENINLDLLAALPGQPLQTLERSLSRCVELRPEHVTVYIYNNDPQTALARQIARGRKPAVGSVERTDAYVLSREVLCDAGYIEYMPMYFALTPERRFAGEEHCFGLKGDIFGFGSGAHSLIAGHVLTNGRGKLDRFLADPLTFDRVDAVTEEDPSSFMMQLLQALVFGTGVEHEDFESTLGIDYERAWASPAYARWREGVERYGARIVKGAGSTSVQWPGEDPSARWRLLAG